MAGRRWTKQRLLRLYALVMGVTGGFLLALSARDVVAEAVAHPPMWLMTVLAVVAGMLAFIERPTPGRPPLIVCPTICFTFAIQLCWGFGPAIAAQAVAVLLVRWKLHAPMVEAVKAWGQYTLAFAASGAVLWLGQPDPFERNGPTNIATDAIAVVLAVVAWIVVYAALEFVHSVLRGAPARSRSLTSAVGNQLLFKASLLLLSPVLAVAAHINVGFVPLVFAPLFAVQRMARLSAERDRAARMDPLTGLANRAGLRAGFNDLLAARGRVSPDGVPAPAVLSLLMLDLDRFKHVNDTLGHDVGDRLLVAVAERIAAVQPAESTVARLGGDEFAILLATHTPQEAERVACTVVHALARPVALDRLQIDVTASLGIASYSDGEDFPTLLRHADVAMYEAKQRGDAVATYAARADQNSPERLKLLTDFRDALTVPEPQQIAMHYQPQVSLATGEVEGVEALLRWHHPVHGLVPTRDLLSVAEHSSVMQQLTMRVIDDVTAQAAAWRGTGLTLRASLNVSVRDLYSDDLATHLAARLRERGVPPERVQVEITESALLADPSRVQATVNRIAALGVAISLDDFGTGYSSLQHLRRLPISEIKIDRSFVAGMADNRDDAAIVRSIVEMARTLGIRTVAEGVENEYTRQLLAEAGCTLIQGWIAAHPMPGAELVRWLSAADVVRRPARGGALPVRSQLQT
ncbi:putative bifunctional diguanylate cyclase/phosphodiesterase [Phytohabitans houttuyneae]|nr:EAL domain-containing protein [Phytohabitans houttuyneae]